MTPFSRKEVLMSSNGRRVFFGFEFRHGWLCVVALDVTGEALLRARFPLPSAIENESDTDLDHGPVSHIANSLSAFVRACNAEPVCGTDHTPNVLVALARYLGGPIRYIDMYDLELTAPPGFDRWDLFELGAEAHWRAILAALAANDPKELL
jgi:hypothetical protein